MRGWPAGAEAPNREGAVKAPSAVAQAALPFIRNERRLKGQHRQWESQFMAVEVSVVTEEVGVNRGFVSSMFNGPWFIGFFLNLIAGKVSIPINAKQMMNGWRDWKRGIAGLRLTGYCLRQPCR
jgi:hypothetical protein